MSPLTPRWRTISRLWSLIIRCLNLSMNSKLASATSERWYTIQQLSGGLSVFASWLPLVVGSGRVMFQDVPLVHLISPHLISFVKFALCGKTLGCTRCLPVFILQTTDFVSFARLRCRVLWFSPVGSLLAARCSQLGPLQSGKAGALALDWQRWWGGWALDLKGLPRYLMYLQWFWLLVSLPTYSLFYHGQTRSSAFAFEYFPWWINYHLAIE